MRILLNILAIVLLTAPSAWGQNADSIVTSTRATVGIELDALPYMTGGYYGSLWYGVKHLRFRGVITKTIIPEFLLPGGYKNNHIKVAAFIVDFFPMERFQDWWIGGGVEFWKATIEHEGENVVSSYSNTVLTLGGGYVWKFYKNLYLNPWGACHLIVSGDKEVSVGSRTYKPAILTGEVSLKIGWHF